MSEQLCLRLLHVYYSLCRFVGDIELSIEVALREFPSVFGSFLFLCLLIYPMSSYGAAPIVDNIFSNGAVFQEGKDISLSGTAASFSRISVQVNNGERVVVSANSFGVWKATLPPMRSANQSELKVIDLGTRLESTTSFSVGEVWICGGQSNMAMTVRQNIYPVTPTPSEAMHISEFRVEPNVLLRPRADMGFDSRWRKGDKAGVGDFSAVCYFFAKERFRLRGVPIGIILSAIGATSIVSWAPGVAFESVARYRGFIDQLNERVQNPLKAFEEYGVTLRRWAQGQSTSGFSAAAPWGKFEGSRKRGLVWYRIEFDASRQTVNAPSQLVLKSVRGSDTVWLNGVCIGSSSHPSTSSRIYELGMSRLSFGRNEIIVAVDTPFEDGGLLGVELSSLEQTRASVNVPGSALQTFVSDVTAGSVPRPSWHYSYGPALAWNAMLSPLSNIPASGLVWYQGEGGSPGGFREYFHLLDSLVREFRGLRNDFLVLIVQLPRIESRVNSYKPGDWAVVREAQRVVALSSALNGLVVTLDIGKPQDLHPTGKELLGQRIANAARQLQQGLVPDGAGAPQFGVVGPREYDVMLEGVEVDTRLGYGFDPVGFEICSETRATCVPVQTKLRDNIVRLTVEMKLPPGSYVYYCWGNSLSCNLKVRSSPLSPFRISLN